MVTSLAARYDKDQRAAPDFLERDPSNVVRIRRTTVCPCVKVEHSERASSPA
jgi:hypothetical protein